MVAMLFIRSACSTLLRGPLDARIQGRSGLLWPVCQLDAELRRNGLLWPVLKLSWLKMSVVSPRCLLDAVRRSGLLVEVVLPIFAISLFR